MPGPILNFNKWRSVNESKKSGFDSIYESADPPKTAAEIKAFQTWVVYTKNDTTILGKSGPKGDGVDGVMTKGGNTEKAWNQYGKVYLDEISKKTEKKEADPIKGIGQSNVPSNLSGLGWYDSMAGVKQKLAVDRKKFILAYFTSGDSCEACKRMENELFKTPEFKEWVGVDVIPYVATIPSDEAAKSKIDLIKEYEGFAKTFNVAGYPTVKIVELSDNSYKVKLTKTYKGEKARDWINDISRYVEGIGKSVAKSEKFGEAEYNQIISGIAPIRLSIEELIKEYNELSEKRLVKSVEGLSKTLEQMPDKLACDLKYTEFWKVKRKYLDSKINPTAENGNDTKIYANQYYKANTKGGKQNSEYRKLKTALDIDKKKIGEIIAELDKIIAMCDGIKLGESPKPKEEKKEDKSKIQKTDDTKDFSDFTMVGKKGKNKRGSGETEEDPGPSVDSQIERTGKPKKEEPKTVKSFLKNQAKKRGIIN
jgi:hypothetical protein